MGMQRIVSVKRKQPNVDAGTEPQLYIVIELFWESVQIVETRF